MMRQGLAFVVGLARPESLFKLSMVSLCLTLFSAQGFSAHAEDMLWTKYAGVDGPGKGKKIVFVTGDDEYRSEESMPQMARILAKHHGFDCTVLYAIDPATSAITPNYQENIPGLEALDDADLMVLFVRFRDLPPDQMAHILSYVESGRPIVACRTSTHPFSFRKYASGGNVKLNWDSNAPGYEGGFGRQVLGETWISHYGVHQSESTRGLPAPGQENHPILKGVKDIWGPSDVYEVGALTGDSQPVVLGQVLTGMQPSDPPKADKRLMPLAWIKSYAAAEGKKSRIFTTTLGHAGDFENEGVRRLFVNACYWALKLEEKIDPARSVDFVGEYKPTPIGFEKFKVGVKPADHNWP